MSKTPAAILARVRVTHGGRWRIDKAEGHLGVTYTATERSTRRKIVTDSLADLEARLERAELGRDGG